MNLECKDSIFFNTNNYFDEIFFIAITTLPKSLLMWKIKKVNKRVNKSDETTEYTNGGLFGDQNNISNIHGWKIQIAYHKVWGFKNLFRTRGDSRYFIDDVIVLDKELSLAVFVRAFP